MHPAAAYQPERFNQIPQIMPRNDSIRDRIRNEFSEIRDALQSHQSDDNLHNDVALWCRTFERAFLIGAVRDIDLQQTIQHALETMQRIFRCSLPPLDPNNPAPLTTVGDPLSSCISRWLAGYGVVVHPPVLPLVVNPTALPQVLQLAPSPAQQPIANNRLPVVVHDDEDEEEILAQELERELLAARNNVPEQPPAPPPQLNRLAPPPVPLNHPAPPLMQLPIQNNPEPELDDDEEEDLAEEIQRQLIEAMMQREQQNARRIPELRELREGIMAAAVPILEQYRAAMRQNAAEHHANLDVLEQRIEGLAAQVYPAVNELMQANQRLAQDHEARGRRAEELRGRLEREDAHMGRIEQEAAQLKVELNDLNQRIDEREQERNDSLIKTIMIVAACVIINFILPGAGSAAGAAGAGGAGAASAGAAGAGVGAAAAGTGAAAGAGAAATGATIVPGLHVGVAPVTGGGKIGLFWTW